MESVEDNISQEIKDILYKFDYTNGRPLIVLSNRGKLYGLISSGDIRRYLSKKIEPIENTSVGEVCNLNPLVVKQSDSNTVIERLLSENITLIPVLDSNRKVISCVFNDFPCLKIGNKTIASNAHYVYLIAEIGVNHNGSYDEAKYLIDKAIDAGFDDIKLLIRYYSFYDWLLES